MKCRGKKFFSVEDCDFFFFFFCLNLGNSRNLLSNFVTNWNALWCSDSHFWRHDSSHRLLLGREHNTSHFGPNVSAHTPRSPNETPFQWRLNLHLDVRVFVQYQRNEDQRFCHAETGRRKRFKIFVHECYTQWNTSQAICEASRTLWDVLYM
jgi:hypothetical protein